MVGLEPKNIYNYDYGSYKGYFAENFVIQELTALLNKDLYSWQEGTSEIELLVDVFGQIIPVEIKAGINKKAKSLKVFVDRYKPEKSFLISGNPVSLKKAGLSYLPLYSVSLLNQLKN